jgi:hypothetical protein
MERSNSSLADGSLNKAAHLLGVNELNSLDYKSLNSIRKLSKTLGCAEVDLMRTFTTNTSNGIKPVKGGLTTKNSFSVKKKKINMKQQQQPTLDLAKSIKKTLRADVNANSKNSNSKLTALNPEILAKANNLTLNDKHINLNQLISSLTQKRKITLHKDEKLGFGFIAGSEKPLVIRFVTPGNEYLLLKQKKKTLLFFIIENMKYLKRWPGQEKAPEWRRDLVDKRRGRAVCLARIRHQSYPKQS